MSAITPEIVKQVALLARLKLEGKALSQTAAQLDEILTYVQRLQAVPTDGVEPTSHVLPLSNVLREDVPQRSLPQQAVTSLAPAAQPPFVKVPKVIES
ncbi:MAG: Asp-tRNA(Asn)/Glu-tRNA(Gln) amidotransferase subunit GatC [Candidatus Omnitrophica bacterium]|nr:Asp-tRNA(Asn)/Glu-tRNA(Gln) amidotransferase subunit GatC [Candidatus Omnitrophota bacterium]